MITRSKLSNQPENKLTNKFQPIDMDTGDYMTIGGSKNARGKRRAKRRKVVFVLLPLLLIVVAGGTFGAIYLVTGKNKTDEPSGGISEPEIDTIENTEPVEPVKENNIDMSDETARRQINQMIGAYTIDYPGREITVVDCEHLENPPTTGLVCNLVDKSYGSDMITEVYEKHLEWQWLERNMAKYGFSSLKPWRYQFIGIEIKPEEPVEEENTEESENDEEAESSEDKENNENKENAEGSKNSNTLETKTNDNPQTVEVHAQ